MRVAFRFESGHDIGMGHMMRCLTLASALRDRGALLTFLCQSQTADALMHYLPDTHCLRLDDGLSEERDAMQCAGLLSNANLKPDWLVVDHYRFAKVFETAMRPAAHRIMAIDDLGREHDCDLLLDANFTLAGKERYAGKVPEGCRMLLGPDYALLRRDFQQALASRQPHKGLRIFVCFGGSDPQQATGWAAEILADMLPVTATVDIVVGYSYVGKEALENLCDQHPNWTLWSDHPHPEHLMAGADFSVGAGGTMTWERCAMGLPSIVISIADNQHESCKALAARGLICYLGDYGAVSADQLREAVEELMSNEKMREAMASGGRALVNICGAEHVAGIML